MNFEFVNNRGNGPGRIQPGELTYRLILRLDPKHNALERGRLGLSVRAAGHEDIGFGIVHQSVPSPNLGEASRQQMIQTTNRTPMDSDDQLPDLPRMSVTQF